LWSPRAMPSDTSTRGTSRPGVSREQKRLRRIANPAVLNRRSSTDEGVEHRPPVVAVVVAPRELVQVSLQPSVGDLLVIPTDAGLEVPEEALDGVRVGISHDVLASGVPDSTMTREVPTDLVVRGPLVSVDD